MRALYIMRGAPGSGKSTWLKQNGYEPLAVSPDALRLALVGLAFDETGQVSISQSGNTLVWDRVAQIVEARMRRGLTTVLDSTMAKTANMSPFRKLAEKYRYRVYVVDFTDIDKDICKQRNAERAEYKRVPQFSIDRMYSLFKSNPVPKSIPVLSPEAAKRQLDAPEPFDVSKYSAVNFIGDIHGCYTALTDLMQRIGDPEDPEMLREDELYVFLGDYLDRGTENAQVLDFIMRASQRNNVRMLEGNHEKFLAQWANDEIDELPEEFVKTTLGQLETADVDKKDVRRFIRRLAQMSYLSYRGKTMLACHGGISCIPAPFAYLSANNLIHGFGKYGDIEAVEEMWEETSEEIGVYLVHGHRAGEDEPARPFDCVLCLEGAVEHGGNLRCARFGDGGVETIQVQNAVFHVFAEKVDLDRETNMSRIITALRDNEAIVEKSFGGVSSFNFSNKAFIKGLWDNQTIRARGLFIDTEACRVKARSYDKFFAVGEREETSLESLQRRMVFPVNVYLKENGYLGICSSNDDGTLFTASKSTVNGDYAKRFTSLLEAQLKGRQEEFAHFLSERNLSAVFEVIEPVKDPHIVEYDTARIVLLALVRNEIRFSQLSYEELVKTASQFGLQPKKLIARVESFEEFAMLVNRTEEEDWTLDGKKVEGFVAEDKAGCMVKVKCMWYRKWKCVRGMLRDISKRGRSAKIERLKLCASDADEIYEAAKKYVATHSKRGGKKRTMCAPPDAENVIMFRKWYEERMGAR